MNPTRDSAFQSRSRISSALVIAAVVLLVPLTLVLTWLWVQWHALESGYPLIADTLRIALFLLPLALLAYGGTVGVLIIWRRYGWRESVFADKQTALMRAQKQIAPLATSFTYHDAHQVSASAPLALPEANSMIAVPTFAQLLDSGAVAADRDFILGYADAGAITGDLKSLFSSGIGGLQGSGKSWTAAYLLAQAAIHGAKLVVCDPHAGDSESLAHRVGALAPALLCRIADDDASILAALTLADDVLQKRKRGDDADRTALIVAVDEWSSLRRGKLADLLPVLVEDFSTEGRKLNCHVMLLGQRWDKASVGDFRNTLASAYVHRMRADEARMMSGLPAGVLPANTISLRPGESYFICTRGEVTRVQIPQMALSDMARVGQLLGGPTPSSAGSRAAPQRRAMGFQVGTQTAPLPTSSDPQSTQIRPASATAATQAGSGQTLSAEALRAFRLFTDDATDITQIVLLLRNVKPKDAAKYQQALKEIQASIRACIAAGVQ